MPAPIAPAPLPAAPMTFPTATANISVFELENKNVYLAPKPMYHHPVAAACCGPVHGPGMSAGVILVLFILLVIILRSFRI